MVFIVLLIFAVRMFVIYCDHTATLHLLYMYVHLMYCMSLVIPWLSPEMNTTHLVLMYSQLLCSLEEVQPFVEVPVQP